MQYIFNYFANIKQLDAYLNSTQPQQAFKPYMASIATDRSHIKNAKTKDFAEANDLLMYGDKKTAKKIDDAGFAKVRCEIAKYMIHRQPYSSVVGFAANVPAYLAGSPNSMINIKQNKTKEKVVNIAYSVTTSWSTDPNDIISAGTNLLSAICKIEAGGIRVNLFSCWCIKNNSGTQLVGFATKVKDSKEKIDTLKVAYPLCNPSMQRRHAFKWTENTEGLDPSIASGYGNVVGGDKLKELLTANNCKCDVAFQFNDIAYRSTDRIIQMIEAQMKK